MAIHIIACHCGKDFDVLCLSNAPPAWKAPIAQRKRRRRKEPLVLFICLPFARMSWYGNKQTPPMFVKDKHNFPSPSREQWRDPHSGSRKTTATVHFYPLLSEVSKIGRDLLYLWYVALLSIVNLSILLISFTR